MGIGREESRKTADSGYDHQRSRMLFWKLKKINSSEGNTATPEGDYWKVPSGTLIREPVTPLIRAVRLSSQGSSWVSQVKVHMKGEEEQVREGE